MYSFKERAKTALKRIVDSRFAIQLLQMFDHRSENRMSELGMISQAFEFKKINGVQGDYFEFGLWRGKTFRYAYRMKKFYGQKNMLLWGFDSFKGLPTITDKRDNVWKQGEFACSEHELRHTLIKSGFKEHEYRLISGYYEESLTDELHQQLSDIKAAIIYIDCDLYESTKEVLKFIHRYLVNGSIICFDDYYNYKGAPDQGEQRAIKEFTDQQSEISLIPYFNFSPLGKSFIVRRA